MSTQTVTVEFKTQYPKARKVLPFVLMLVVVLLDQLTKYFIAKNIPLGNVGYEFFGDALKIIHVANPGIAFSIGNGWSFVARGILFRIVPLVVLVAVVIAYCKSDSLTTLQNWAICGVCGGGFGNLIDRFFRDEGVVDFIDVKFYGIFGLERWPTFNVADSAVVICGILLLASFLFSAKQNGEVAR